MTQAAQRLTLEEYLDLNDGLDQVYEFFDGQLIDMPPESPRNSRIALFLLLELGQLFPEDQLCHKDTEIVTSGSRVRIPDLMVLSPELALLLQNSSRGTITADLPPPELVVEVVSPGKANEERDYRYKRSEYAARGIPEYWAIDPEANKITVFILESGFYDGVVYQGDNLIQTRLTNLQLTANQILNRRRSAVDD